MNKYLNRAIPWITSIVSLLAIEQIFEKPKQVYWLVAFILCLIIISVWQLLNRKIKEKRFWFLLFTPLLFFLGSSLFLSFLQGRYIKHFFAVFVAVSLGIFFEVIHSKFHNRIKYQPHSLETVSFNLNIVSIFLLSSGFFSLILFLGFSVLLFATLFTLTVLFLNFQLAWFTGSRFEISKWYILTIVLIMTEAFWAINYLPTSVYVNAALLTSGYYLLAGLSRNWLLDIKEPKVVKRYLFTTLIISVIILITAKWF